MNSRERVRASLQHTQPDKVAIDFGATPTTGISASLVYKLRQALGLKEKRIRIVDCYQMLGEIDEELREALHTDCVQILPYSNLFGFRNDGWKEWTMFDGTPVLVPEHFNTELASNGGLLQYPGGDKTVPASGYMPKGGFYFDSVSRASEFDEEDPCIEDNLEEFTLLSEEELRYAQRETDELYKNTDCAIVACPGSTALGDIALVPAPFLKHPKGIRSIEEWYVSMVSRPDFLKELFDAQTQIAVENLKLYFQAVGNKVDVVYLCGTDFGTQNAPFCSQDLFNDIYLPYYKRMTDWIHRNTNWKVFKHSCGSLMPLIDSMIEAGIDILNPVQNSAKNMDPQTLKDRFGDRITFWGGGVDTQGTLPFGTPEQVYDEVSQRIRIYHKQGGFVFNTIHNAQANIPIDNFIAMIEAVKNNR